MTKHKPDRKLAIKAMYTAVRERMTALAIISLLMPIAVAAQKAEPRDSIPTHNLDSIGTEKGEKVISIESYAARFDPQKALLYSAVLPGLGQVYNNSAWKVPIIYGGFVALGYYIQYNQDRYVFYKDLLYRVLNEPSPLVIVDPDTGDTAGGNRFINGQVVPYPYNIGIQTLRQRVQRYQRDRDFGVMLTALWYVLQIVEAHVDAHLKEFKVNPQLNVMVEPAIQSNYLTGRTSGLSLKLRF